MPLVGSVPRASPCRMADPVRSPTQMTGYYGLDESPIDAKAGCTPAISAARRQGNLWITGRSKDMMFAAARTRRRPSTARWRFRCERASCSAYRTPTWARK
jgi:hypothetical protein